MTSPEQGNVVQQYSCRCRNITISAYDTGSDPSSTAKPDTESDYHRVFVGEDGIHINHHYLTLRTRNRAQESKTSPNKLIQHLALSCLTCKTLTYRVSQEISRGAEAREGPVVPTEDWVEHETLLSKNGWIEVFVGPDGCLVGEYAIEQHFKPLQLSRTFSICVSSHSDTPTSSSIEPSPLSQTWLGSSTDDTAKPFPLPTQLLPSLPPLFPPPPFTSSHPVFLSLSAFAITKSAGLRQQAEEEIRSFVKAKLDALENEEAQLRKEVEGIWRAYREGWKGVLGRVNEERRRALPPKADAPVPASSAKSGVPMSIRDFSPIVQPHPKVDRSPRTSMSPRTSSQSALPPSASLLSASMIQVGSHLPTPTRSPALESIMSGSAAQHSNSGAPSISTVPSSRAIGTRSSTTSPSSFPNHHGDVQFPGAFKRNMDTNVDIASSVAWVQGEEEMRRRFGGKEDGAARDRARKRTSKDLGIGAVDTKSVPPVEVAILAPKGEVQPIPESRKQLTSGPPRESDFQTLGDTHGSSPGNEAQPGQQDSGSTGKAKRRVKFDVQPQVAIVDKMATTQPSEPAADVELFELDDLQWSEHNQESDAQPFWRPAGPQPIVRTSSYRLWPREGASASHPASLPVPRPIPPQSSLNGKTNRIGGSTRRSVGLADALPLLSSSVPARDRMRSLEMTAPERQAGETPGMLSSSFKGTTASHTHLEPDTEDDRISSPAPPSTSNTDTEPAEAELKHLLAASAPSHRHAWREGGRAWAMFHQRAQDKKKKIKGTIAEEGSEGTSSSLDDDSDLSSGESLNGTWRNPSQYASSLPVQIRPLAQYRPTLEPKTSLTDKQGVLVPPLKVTNTRLNSAKAIRKAVYAERDRTRSIDPGPALDFNEQDEIEDEGVLPDTSDGERGRRHALSILQAGSIIPEAGMWRSMAS